MGKHFILYFAFCITDCKPAKLDTNVSHMGAGLQETASDRAPTSSFYLATSGKLIQAFKQYEVGRKAHPLLPEIQQIEDLLVGDIAKKIARMNPEELAQFMAHVDVIGRLKSQPQKASSSGLNLVGEPLTKLFFDEISKIHSLLNALREQGRDAPEGIDEDLMNLKVRYNELHAMQHGESFRFNTFFRFYSQGPLREYYNFVHTLHSNDFSPNGGSESFKERLKRLKDSYVQWVGVAAGENEKDPFLKALNDLVKKAEVGEVQQEFNKFIGLARNTFKENKEDFEWLEGRLTELSDEARALQDEIRSMPQDEGLRGPEEIARPAPAVEGPDGFVRAAPSRVASIDGIRQRRIPLDLEPEPEPEPEPAPLQKSRSLPAKAQAKPAAAAPQQPLKKPIASAPPAREEGIGDWVCNLFSCNGRSPPPQKEPAQAEARAEARADDKVNEKSWFASAVESFFLTTPSPPLLQNSNVDPYKTLMDQLASIVQEILSKDSPSQGNMPKKK